MTGKLSFSKLQSPGWRFLFCLAGLFLTSACAGGGASSNEAATPRGEQVQPPAEMVRRENDPCVLVTSAEAEQLLAALVETERPSELNNEYLAGCRYVAPRGESVAVLVVKVSRKSGAVGFQNAKQMEELGMEIQQVPGVGDDAFWVGDPLHTLYVLQDTVYLDIGGDVQLEQVRPHALTALQRLR